MSNKNRKKSSPPPKEEQADNIIVLLDENGNEISFEVLDIIGYNGKNYIVLLSTDEDADEIEILAQDEDAPTGEKELTTIDDSDVLEGVFALFKERHRDEFNFE